MMHPSVERALEEISAAIYSSDEFDLNDPDDTEQREKIDELIGRLERWVGALQAKKLHF